jgi:type 1 fimbriae regulatory protein FimB
MQFDLNQLGATEQAAFAALLAKAQTGVESPVMAPKKRTRKPETVKYLTEEQVNRFFAQIKAPRDTAIFRVIYHRGLRASELGRIQVSDVQMSEGRIVFDRKKGSYGGPYRMASSEERAVKAWLRIRGDDPGPLFPSREGKGISQQMLDVLMKKYSAAAGIPRELAHCHSLKHSCATHLLARGESLESVQDHLGHRSIKSTEVYAKFTNREKRDKRLRDW